MRADRGEGGTEVRMRKNRRRTKHKNGNKKKEEKKGGNKKAEIRKIKIGFWNVTDLDNKDAQFWDYIKEFNIIGMNETWIDEQC